MRVISYIRLSSETQIDNQSANNQKEVNTLEINKLKESKDISPHTQPEVIDDSGISGLLEFKDRKFGKNYYSLKKGIIFLHLTLIDSQEIIESLKILFMTVRLKALMLLCQIQAT